MILSSSIKTLAEALAAANAELKNPYNSADNPYFKSKYAPLSDVLSLVRPILAKNGLSIIQSPRTEEDGKIGVETMLLHKSGEYIISEPYFVKLAKSDPQAAGSAITYARRYSLNSILAINGEEDDDGNGSSGMPPEKPPTDVSCPVCGKKINAVRGKDGTVTEPHTILSQLGMCIACAKANSPKNRTDT